MACRTGGAFTTITAMGAIRTKIQVQIFFNDFCNIIHHFFYLFFIINESVQIILVSLIFLIEFIHADHYHQCRNDSRFFVNILKCCGNIFCRNVCNAYLPSDLSTFEYILHIHTYIGI